MKFILKFLKIVLKLLKPLYGTGILSDLYEEISKLIEGEEEQPTDYPVDPVE